MTDQSTAPAFDPLDMATNLSRAIRHIAEMQASPDPDVQLQTVVHNMGKTAVQNADVAWKLALVSIAGDFRRMADVWERLAWLLDPEGHSAGAWAADDAGDVHP